MKIKNQKYSREIKSLESDEQITTTNDKKKKGEPLVLF